MRKYISLLLLFVVCIAACKKKQEDVLADIKKNTAHINDKLKDYTHKEVEDIVSPGGGNISGYYRDDEIKKIIAQRFTDTNRIFSEYYFDDGMLIFAIEQKFVYNRPSTYTQARALALGDSIWYDDKKTQMQVNRYYLHDNKLIKWLDQDNANRAVNNEAFTNKQSELWAQAAVLVKELKEQ